MTEKNFQIAIYSWIAFGFLVFIVLLFVSAPYGRHNRKGWGPTIPNRLGWVIMELPSLLLFAGFFLFGRTVPSGLTWLFFILWVMHYGHRSLVYPFRTKTSGKQMPLIIALFAVFFNVVNGSMNGLYFSSFAPVYDLSWLYDARFIIGIVVFIVGVAINFHSDRILLGLRSNPTNGYKIPHRGLFKYVSCPNFFGEILEWTGFAIMTWSPAALAFALWTFFNLVPRALDHHKWYKKEFEAYPEERKAVIPYVL